MRVAAPEHMSEDTIRLAIVQRLPWIKRQREELQQAQRQTKREMDSGETHYVWGQRYRLDVSRTSGKHHVEVKGQTLWVETPEGSDGNEKRATLDRWYRREVKAAVPALLAKWQPIVGAEAERLRAPHEDLGHLRARKRSGSTRNWRRRTPHRYIIVHGRPLHERTHNDRLSPSWTSFCRIGANVATS